MSPKLVFFQKERDTTVFFLGSLGPDSFSFLRQYHQQTEASVGTVQKWDFPKVTNVTYMRTKEAFLLHLQKLRNQLVYFPTKTVTPRMALEGYTIPIEAVITEIRDTVSDGEHGSSWKDLVSYVSLADAINDIGYERSLGKTCDYEYASLTYMFAWNS